MTTSITTRHIGLGARGAQRALDTEYELQHKVWPSLVEPAMLTGVVGRAASGSDCWQLFLWVSHIGAGDAAVGGAAITWRSRVATHRVSDTLGDPRRSRGRWQQVLAGCESLGLGRTGIGVERDSGTAPKSRGYRRVPTPACRTDAGDLAQRPSSNSHLPADPAPRLSRRHPQIRPNMLHERPVQHALFLGTRCSADTLRSAHGSPDSPDHPNRGGEVDTSKAWPRPNCAPAQTVWEGWRAIDGHRMNISHPPGSPDSPSHASTCSAS
jgi:hypothetical protein